MSRHALVASFVSLALGAVLTAAPRADGAVVSGTGSGHVDLGGVQHFVTFNLSAHTGPKGAYGSCRFTFEADQIDVHVDVDCLNAFPQAPGAGAWVSGLVKRVTPDPNTLQIKPGDRMFFFVTDYGNSGDSPADQVGVYLLAEFVGCNTLGTSAGAPIDTGNITINLGN